jgi:hypothetical protein
VVAAGFGPSTHRHLGSGQTPEASLLVASVAQGSSPAAREAANRPGFGPVSGGDGRASARVVNFQRDPVPRCASASRGRNGVRRHPSGRRFRLPHEQSLGRSRSLEGDRSPWKDRATAGQKWPVDATDSLAEQGLEADAPCRAASGNGGCGVRPFSQREVEVCLGGPEPRVGKGAGRSVVTATRDRRGKRQEGSRPR